MKKFALTLLVVVLGSSLSSGAEGVGAWGPVDKYMTPGPVIKPPSQERKDQIARTQAKRLQARRAKVQPRRSQVVVAKPPAKEETLKDRINRFETMTKEERDRTRLQIGDAPALGTGQILKDSKGFYYWSESTSEFVYIRFHGESSQR